MKSSLASSLRALSPPPSQPPQKDAGSKIRQIWLDVYWMILWRTIVRITRTMKAVSNCVQAMQSWTGWDYGSQEFQQKDKVLLPQALKVVGENCEPQTATTRVLNALQRRWRLSAIEALTQWQHLDAQTPRLLKGNLYRWMELPERCNRLRVWICLDFSPFMHWNQLYTPNCILVLWNFPMLASRTQKSTSNALRAARPFVDRRPSELEVLPWCEGMSCLSNEAQQVHARVSLSESKPYRILCGSPGMRHALPDWRSQQKELRFTSISINSSTIRPRNPSRWGRTLWFFPTTEPWIHHPTKLLGLIWSQAATLVSLEHYEAAAETRWRALSLDLATWSKKLRELMTSYYFVVKIYIIDYYIMCYPHSPIRMAPFNAWSAIYISLCDSAALSKSGRIGLAVSSGLQEFL